MSTGIDLVHAAEQFIGERDCARFWDKVDRNGPNGCWLWTGAVTAAGYGQFRLGGRMGSQPYAHRYAYEQMVGPIPEGLQIDHLCFVKRCVNPAHLEPVTPRENTVRAARAGRMGLANSAKTHCPQGHPYDAENTYVAPSGRQCKECNRTRARERQRRRRAEQAS